MMQNNTVFRVLTLEEAISNAEKKKATLKSQYTRRLVDNIILDIRRIYEREDKVKDNIGKTFEQAYPYSRRQNIIGSESVRIYQGSDYRNSFWLYGFCLSEQPNYVVELI